MIKVIGTIFRVGAKVLMAIPDEYRNVANATEADYIDVAQWWEATGLPTLGSSPSSRTVMILEDEEANEYRFEMASLGGCGLSFDGSLGGRPYFHDHRHTVILWRGGCIPAGMDVMSE